MKKTLRVFTICLIAALLSVNCLYATFESSQEKIASKMSDAIGNIESSLVVSKERMEKESAALVQYNDLIKGMQSITKSKDIYLDSYGGAYIDDNGDLVVCITENSDRTSSVEIIKNLTRNPKIKTKVVKHSLNYLHQKKLRFPKW